jgi:hypothetical protein
VCEAQRKRVHLLLIHEHPSILEETEERRACEFNDFWNEGWTPRHLLTGKANVYQQIANPLRPGLWRKAGLARIAINLAGGGGKREQWQCMRSRRAGSPV